jgi:hypothetical protein
MERLRCAQIKHFWTKFYVNPALLWVRAGTCCPACFDEAGQCQGHRGQGHRGRGHRRCPYTIACHPASLS